MAGIQTHVQLIMKLVRYHCATTTTALVWKKEMPIGTEFEERFRISSDLEWLAENREREMKPEIKWNRYSCLKTSRYKKEQKDRL